jgi:integrase
MATELRTQSDVFGLPLPAEGKEAVYFDEGKPKDRVQGLGLRIRGAGSRRWVFLYRYNGALKKLGLGDGGALSLEAARKKARAHRVTLDNGDDPANEKIEKRAASKLTFAAVADDFLVAKRPGMKPRTFEEYDRTLKETLEPLHKLPLASVTRPVVASTLRDIAKKREKKDGGGKVGGGFASNRARATLSSFFSWAVGEGLAEENPVVGTNRAVKEAARDRVLTDAELVKIWRAADGSYGRIVKLLMLTGQRRDEIGSLHWSEIEHIKDPAKAQIALPKERTKNSRPHDVPLSELAVAELKTQPVIAGRDLVFGTGEGGFSGWSKAKAELDEECRVKAWRLHDLRRTAATRMADLGVQPHVVEAVLNHVSGHRAGVAGIYNRSVYTKEKREALALWASHLKVELAKATGANVTRLKRAKVKA